VLIAGLLLGTSSALAGVVVTTSGNTAIANISLTSGRQTYSADVTIAFTGAQNLNPTELNLSAQLVNPRDPGLLSRLPACTNPLLGCVTIDPNFPMLITVEPLSLRAGNLSFLNAYTFEVHTSNLAYVPYSQYRLDKAPITGAFDDVSTAIESGSVRARGSGGTFSQFLVVADTRPSLAVEILKEANLQSGILSASLSDTVQNDLLNLLGNVHSAVGLGDYTAAILSLDGMISEIQTHAGTDIANVWSSNHLLTNDAGDMLSLAQTLRFTLVLLQNGH
jgi:hypothetical protein